MNRITIEDTRKIMYDPILHKDKNIDEYIQEELATHLEGVCNEVGLIVPGSIIIQKRSVPALNTLDIGGLMFIMVSYSAEVIEIPQGSILDATIRKMNKMGIQAEVDCWCSGEKSSEKLIVANVMIPTELMESQKDEELNIFDLFKEGEMVRVKILGSRFHSGDKIILCVGVLNEESE
jgi:DNA-directed RNA polymerase subunit E'/Rpb7